MIFFTSDLHFGHKNIINSCKRPFETIEEMDETLIKNWNSRVKNGDIVYIIGDLFWGKKPAKAYIPRLNGKKILIVGNHDSWLKNAVLSGDFECSGGLLEAKIQGKPITFCHYPMLEWRDSNEFGTKNLGFLVFGHIHNNFYDEYSILFQKPNALNAGVDVNGFMPVTFEELQKNNENHVLSVLKRQDEKALYLARKYHAYQVDKAGIAYVRHVEAVASAFDDEILRSVALMHDLFEDTDIPREIIRENFSSEIFDAILAMTKSENEDYFDYIRRVGSNPLARQVKLSDLRHNMDLSRLKEVTDRDLKRVEKYKAAYEMLSK